MPIGRLSFENQDNYSDYVNEYDGLIDEDEVKQSEQLDY